MVSMVSIRLRLLNPVPLRYSTQASTQVATQPKGLKWLQPQLAPKQKLLTYFFHVSLEKNIKRAEVQRNWFQLSGDAREILDMTKEIW